MAFPLLTLAAGYVGFEFISEMSAYRGAKRVQLEGLQTQASTQFDSTAREIETLNVLKQTGQINTPKYLDQLNDVQNNLSELIGTLKEARDAGMQSESASFLRNLMTGEVISVALAATVAGAAAQKGYDTLLSSKEKQDYKKYREDKKTNPDAKAPKHPWGKFLLALGAGYVLYLGARSAIGWAAGKLGIRSYKQQEEQMQKAANRLDQAIAYFEGIEQQVRKEFQQIQQNNEQVRMVENLQQAQSQQQTPDSTLSQASRQEPATERQPTSPDANNAALVADQASQAQKAAAAGAGK